MATPIKNLNRQNKCRCSTAPHWVQVKPQVKGAVDGVTATLWRCVNCGAEIYFPIVCDGLLAQGGKRARGKKRNKPTEVEQ